jgi:ribose transport system substrate-binding protein
MFRKVTKTGPATLTIALPSKWAKNNNLKPGSYIEIQENPSSLIIAPEQTPTHTIKITYNENFIENMLEKLFLEAESKIIIESQQQLPSLDALIKKFPGFQIIEQQPNKITINRTLKPSIDNPEALIKRCYLIIKEALYENPPTFPDDLNNLIWLLQLNKQSPAQILLLRNILTEVSNFKSPVHDDAYSLLKNIFLLLYKQKYSFNVRDANKIKNIFKEKNELFEKFFEKSNQKLALAKLFHAINLLEQLHREISYQQSILEMNVFESKIKKPLIGVCLKNQSNKFWAVDVKESMELKAFENKDVEYLFDAPLSDFDIVSQEKILKKFIDKKVKGIILAPVEPGMMQKTINKINELNIPLIILDTDIELNNKYTFIGFDNFKGGYLTGLNLKKKLSTKSNVLIIEGHLKGNFSERIIGFKKALGTNYNIDIIRGDFQESVAYEQTIKVFNKKEYKAIFATSDNMALGAIKALEKLNKNAIVCGFDRTVEGIKAMNQGKLFSDVNTKPKELGVLAVQTMTDLLSKKLVPQKIIYDLELIGQSTA